MFLAFLILAGCALLTPTEAANYGYVVDIEPTNPVHPCDGWSHESMHNIFNWSAVEFIELDNGTIWVIGNITTRNPMPTKPFNAKLSTFKWRNNMWTPTLYNIDTNDFCKTLLDEKQVWAKYLERLEEKARRCPFKANQTGMADFFYNVRLEVPDPYADGIYKLRLAVETTELQLKSCAQIVFEFHRE